VFQPRKLVPHLIVVMMSAGCATLQQLQFTEPSLSLESVQIRSLDLQGGAFDLLVDVHNPNAYDLSTTRVEIGIDLEATHFGDAAIAERTTLPAGGNASVRVPIRFVWSGVGAGARALLTRGAVTYGMASKVWLDTPLGARSLQLTVTGEAPLLNNE
jgi:LEA14-like dessication related protein